MKILHLSARYRDGAATIPHIMHKECLGRGHESIWIVGRKTEGVPPHVRSLPKRRRSILSRLLNRCRDTPPPFKTDPRYYFYGEDESAGHVSAGRILKTCGFRPDVICIYWVSGFINAETIRDLWNETHARIHVFLTDMGFYTGGCHYARECLGYEGDCSRCPAISSRHGDRAATNLRLKQDRLRGVPIKFFASRGQSIEMAGKASLLKPFEIIPNVYKVPPSPAMEPKERIRRKFGLGCDHIVFLVGCLHLDDPRKGFSILLDALELIKTDSKVDTKKVQLLLVGKIGRELVERLPFPARCVEHLDFDNELREAFIASDCFLSPVLADTGPYMINLSIYHECPVISFPVGVAKYLCGERKAGILSAGMGVEHYSEAIAKYLASSEAERHGLIMACREVSEQELSWNDGDFDKLFSSESGLDPVASRKTSAASGWE